jgi:hypothetical protein
MSAKKTSRLLDMKISAHDIEEAETKVLQLFEVVRQLGQTKSIDVKLEIYTKDSEKEGKSK